MYNYPEEFHRIYDCLLDKKDEMNIQLAIGLGDITEKNLDSEWAIARSETFRLSGHIPYTLVRGNHDLSDYGGLSDDWREVKFGQYFNNDTYRKELTGFYQNSVENAYKTISINGIDYLILLLDYGASDDVLCWADEVVESYPNHNVIVTTHAFLFRDGTTIDDTDLVPPAKKWGYNNGDAIWDKFIRKHSNIVMVLSGHDPFPEIVRSEMIGDNGNIVNSLLIDPQHIDNYYGPYGVIAFLHFSGGGNVISVEYYSSVAKKFYKPINQFSFSLGGVVASNSECRSMPGMSYESAVDIHDGDLISVSCSDQSSSKSIGYDGDKIISIDNVFNGASLSENGKRLLFVAEENKGAFALKTPSGKFLSFVDNGPLLGYEPAYYSITRDGVGFSFEYDGRYLSYSNGFSLSESPSLVLVHKYQAINENSLENALRYFNRFCNSYVCGFDAFTAASSAVFNVLA
ncbi:MAG: metallophosphoesterase, partial [Bacilli bacterium]|nr:metallophosphoesterase [Bacilli bacterium]